MKLPQVQYINKTGLKVQQSNEVSQQYMDMNVDVPADAMPEYRHTKIGADDPEDAKQ